MQGRVKHGFVSSRCGKLRQVVASDIQRDRQRGREGRECGRERERQVVASCIMQ